MSAVVHVKKVGDGKRERNRATEGKGKKEIKKAKEETER